jgi:hypothetical protein
MQQQVLADSLLCVAMFLHVFSSFSLAIATALPLPLRVRGRAVPLSKWEALIRAILTVATLATLIVWLNRKWGVISFLATVSYVVGLHHPRLL